VKELDGKGRTEVDRLTQELSRLSASIREIRDKYDPAWDSGLRGQVMVTYEQLRNSGSAIVHGDYGQAWDHFDASYQVAMRLKQHLESRSKG
jgi:hypothetical protein